MESVISTGPHEPTKFAENPLLTRETLRRIHSYMVQCRHYSNDNGFGLEAVEVPMSVHLRPGDTIATVGDRWLAASFKTNPLASMMAELFPEHEGSCSPHVIADSAAISTLLGVSAGVAFAYKMQAQANVVLLLARREILDKGSEAFSIAGSKKLPIVFMMESRFDQLSASKVRKLEDEVNVLATISGFPAIPVDGRDAVAVYRVAQEAIARARKGGGPTLIECKMMPGSLDPILHIETYMRKRGM